MFYPDESFDFPNRAEGLPDLSDGISYFFLLKKILANDLTFEQAKKSIENAKRTQNMIMAISNVSNFNTIQYRYIFIF